MEKVKTKLAAEMQSQNIRSETLATMTGLSIDTVRAAKRGKKVSLSTAMAIVREVKHISVGDLV